MYTGIMNSQIIRDSVLPHHSQVITNCEYEVNKSTEWNVQISIQEYYGKEVINEVYGEEERHKVSTNNIVQFLLQIDT